MSNTHEVQQHGMHGSLRSYAIGFVLSIILTFVAYIPAVMHGNSHHQLFSHELLIPLLLTFAFIQLVIQLVFFLHVMQESKPKWNLVFFAGTFALVLMVVVMSMWIMQHLNNNMTPQQMNNYIIKDEGIHK